MWRLSLVIVVLVPGCTPEPHIVQDEGTTSGTTGPVTTGSTGVGTDPEGGTSSTGGSGSASGDVDPSSEGTGTTDGESSGESGESTAAAAVCGDGILEADEECDSLLPEAECHLCIKDRLVFATDLEISPDDMEGLYGADTVCRASAVGAMLPAPETYHAWLSDTKTDAVDRVKLSAGRYYLPGPGRILVATGEQWLSGTLEHPIDRNQYGETITGNAWTGTLSGGTKALDLKLCEDWTKSSDDISGFFGSSTLLNAGWTDEPNELLNPSPCHAQNRLYCIEGK